MAATLDDLITDLSGVTTRLVADNYPQQLLKTDLLLVASAVLEIARRLREQEEFEREQCDRGLD